MTREFMSGAPPQQGRTALHIEDASGTELNDGGEDEADELDVVLADVAGQEMVQFLDQMRAHLKDEQREGCDGGHNERALQAGDLGGAGFRLPVALSGVGADRLGGITGLLGRCDDGSQHVGTARVADMRPLRREIDGRPQHARHCVQSALDPPNAGCA
jgi:hypothetical protein